MAKDRKDYTDEEKASALTVFDSCGGKLREASRKANIPLMTLQGWVHERGINEYVRMLRTQQKVSLVEMAEKTAYSLAEVIFARAQNPSPFDKISELGITFGIFIEKIQLLKGEPTGINLALTEDQKRARLEQIRQMAKAS